MGFNSGFKGLIKGTPFSRSVLTWSYIYMLNINSIRWSHIVLQWTQPTSSHFGKKRRKW